MDLSTRLCVAVVSGLAGSEDPHCFRRGHPAAGLVATQFVASSYPPAHHRNFGGDFSGAFQVGPVRRLRNVLVTWLARAYNRTDGSGRKVSSDVSRCLLL